MPSVDVDSNAQKPVASSRKHRQQFRAVSNFTTVRFGAGSEARKRVLLRDMREGKTLFTPLMEFVPWMSIAGVMQRWDGNNGVHGIHCAEHFRVAAITQLTRWESLCDIEATLSANASNLHSLGMRHAVRRSTLADANRPRNGRIWSDQAARLIRRARRLHADEPTGVELDSTAMPGVHDHRPVPGTVCRRQTDHALKRDASTGTYQCRGRRSTPFNLVCRHCDSSGDYRLRDYAGAEVPQRTPEYRLDRPLAQRTRRPTHSIR